MQRLSGMLIRSTILTLLATGSLAATILLIPGQSWGTAFPDIFSLQGKQDHSLGAGLKGYVPPATSSPPGRSTAGGTRGGGCDGTAPIGLTALAPQQHLGLTSSTHPTFVWYVADETPYPVEVLLYQVPPDDPAAPLEPIGRFDLGLSQSGYMSFTLPEDRPALETDGIYQWRVVVYCREGQPDRSQLGAGNLQVVEPPVDMDSGTDDDPVAQAQALAEAGLWYDAIALLSREPVSASAAAYRREIVGDLAESEAADLEDKDQTPQFVTQLRYLAENP